MDPDRLRDLIRGLPRSGPGSDAATAEALARLGRLPPAPRVLDIGCGPGRQALVLARGTGGHVTAVDVDPAGLSRLADAAADLGLADRIATRQADMRALPFPPGSFDLIWSEGAAYIMGFAAALAAWRPLLETGGAMAVTELTWLVDRPPAPAAAFWAANHPAMATVGENCAAAEAAGYRIVETFALPASAWWDEYYDPLSVRVAGMRRSHGGDTAWVRLLDAIDAEVDLYRRYAEAYGYVFYLLRKKPGALVR
ncbi:MAG TPA: class I SAM-dependent methyltransferase [Azospirillaceae bacterium]|nr:class I SAM-dependent methyltransferase [Azospirillaceae bacterium]